MGTNAAPAGLAATLFSPVQKHLLSLLFGQPEREFQSAELIRLLKSGTGAVHRQLKQLASSGLVDTIRRGNQKYYRANPRSPIFHELRGIVLKTVGLADPLREVLAPLSSQIDAAFVYGSIADGTDRAASDIDLMVISNTLSYGSVFEAIPSVERTLARPVNPRVMSSAAWRRKRTEADSLVARVAAKPKLFLIGTEDDLS